MTYLNLSLLMLNIVPNGDVGPKSMARCYGFATVGTGKAQACYMVAFYVILQMVPLFECFGTFCTKPRL